MLAKAFQYALRGILQAIKSERSVRLLLLFIGLAVVAGLILNLTGTEWCIVLLCCGGVFAAELINTAVECVVDMIVSGYDARAGKAKDVAAGATLIAVVTSLIVGLIIYIPHIIRLFR